MTVLPLAVGLQNMITLNVCNEKGKREYLKVQIKSFLLIAFHFVHLCGGHLEKITYDSL